MNFRMCLILSMGAGMLFLVAVAIVLAINAALPENNPSSPEPEPTSRSVEYFRTEKQLAPAAPESQTAVTLNFGQNLGGGGSTQSCYPQLPPTVTYTFWNPDPADPRNLLNDTIYAYDTENFEAGERVQGSVFRPDGSLHGEATLIAPVAPISRDCFEADNAVGMGWSVAPDDPGGEWRVVFVGADGDPVTYRTNLVAHTEAWISRYCQNGNYALLLDGFAPRERVMLALVEVIRVNLNNRQERIAEAEIISAWQVQVDDLGQAQLTFEDELAPSLSRYFVVTDSDGDVIGNQPSRLSPENRFQACDDDPFASIEVVMPGILSIATLEACPDAPPTTFRIGDTVIVDFNDLGALRLMRTPDEETGVTLGQAYDDDELLLLEGPVCGTNRDRWMWRVQRVRNGTIGWAAEGIVGDAWMCPVSNPECGN